MSPEEAKAKELISTLKNYPLNFTKKQIQTADFILTALYASLDLLNTNISYIFEHSTRSLMTQYRIIASSLSIYQIIENCFDICRILIGPNYDKHTKESLDIYNIGRRFFSLNINLLEKVFSSQKSLNISSLNVKDQELVEFNYSRKLTFFEYTIQAVHSLVAFQKHTNYLLLNWDLRLQTFFICRNTLNYRDLLHRNITDLYFNEKESILRLLTSTYESILTDLKQDYELTKQAFFVQNILFFLEEYKKLVNLLGQKEKTLLLQKQISSFNRKINK